MQYEHINLPGGFYVGEPGNSRQIKTDCIHIFAAPDVAGIEALALEFIGENGSLSQSFSVDNAKTLGVLQYNRDRSKGILTEEEKLLKKLVETAQKDLGSINIDKVVGLLSLEGKVVESLRLDVSENDRHRVVKLGDQGGPIDTINVDELVRQIEAKF